MQAVRLLLISAWRALARAPGYTITAAAVLALGIAGTTTVFGVLKAVVLNPLPYAEPDQLIRIRESKLPEFPQFSVASGKFIVWQHDTTSFASMAMYTGAQLNMTGGPEPVRIRGLLATVDLFNTVGMQPALGRGFGAADAGADSAPAVLSYGAWRTHFNGDEAVIGRTVTLDDKVYNIVGVMPPRFDFPSPLTEIYLLMRPTADDAANIGGHSMGVVGRLKPGITADHALAELNTIAERLEREYPDDSGGWRVLAKPLAEDLLGPTSTRLYLLLGGVALVLLIACANVASLTLVRASNRLHEFAVRRAQGASDGRIARQLIVEGALLGLFAGGIGAALAAMALPLIRAAAPAQTPRIDAVQFEPSIFAVALGISLIAGLIASVLPAVLATRRSVAIDLREGGRGAVGSRGGAGRSALVATEVALAVVLLAGAGVLSRSLAALAEVDPGFRQDGALVTTLALPQSRYDDPAKTGAFYDQLVTRLADVPGVQKVGAAQTIPMISDYVLSFELEGRPEPEGNELQSAIYYSATADFAPALGVKLIKGRGFSSADRSDTARVAMVSESFVRKYFPNEDPIGKRLRPGNGDDAWREIVGVVADVHQYGLDSESMPQMYEPFAQAPFGNAFVLMETALAPTAGAAAMRDVVRQIDANLPVGELRGIGTIVEQTMASRRFSTWLIGGFALSALLLSAIGLYGTLAYLVSQSSRDIGVRLALGAQRRDVVGMVLRQGMLLAGIGAAVGVVVALAGARVLDGQLYGVSARDPMTLSIITLIMLAVAFVASFVPAMRATRVDPMTVLRSE